MYRYGRKFVIFDATNNFQLAELIKFHTIVIDIYIYNSFKIINDDGVFL